MKVLDVLFLMSMGPLAFLIAAVLDASIYRIWTAWKTYKYTARSRELVKYEKKRLKRISKKTARAWVVRR